MTHWFRVHDDLVDDPKVQRLDPTLFKTLINLWCVTSANHGVLPPIEEIAFKLRMKPQKVQQILNELRAAGLIDDGVRGAHPHNWDKRQFTSDVSTSRVRRFRERRGNVSRAASETAPEAEAEADAETEGRTPSQGSMNSRDEAIKRANGWRAPS